MTLDRADLLALFVHVQANLDDDLSLAALAARAGRSPTTFHKEFKALVGETPKAHVDRLRLERAAFRLLVQDERLIDIALDCGFAHHETFARAFRRRFGKPPSDYRDWAREQYRAPRRDGRADPSGYSLSSTKVRRLHATPLAFIRHVGPYENVPPAYFARLAAWAGETGAAGPAIFMGLGHDAPGLTAPSRLRFDACLAVAAPFAGVGEIGCQQFDGGDFAVTTHAGPLATIAAAYAEIFARASALPHHDLIGLPAVEIYQSTVIDATSSMIVTDICLPVTRRR